MTRNERGAVLMIVLIALVGLTVLGSAGLILTKNDLQYSENVEASTEAFYAADAGLQRFMGESNDGSTAVAYTVGSFAVTVTPTPVSTLAGGQQMYHLRSVATGTDARGHMTDRTVSALAIYKPFKPVNVTAALASGTGLLKNGSAGTISGDDLASLTDPACPAPPGPNIAAITVPPDGYEQTGVSDPDDIVPDSIDYQASGEELLNGTGIDWESLSADGGGSPDYVIPPGTWPDFSTIPADEWPVIYVDGNLPVDAGDSGRGTVIVTGNLEMNGSFEWDGLLLVGGYMTSNGFQTVTGGTITGLNILLGESVPTSDVGNGTKKFLYNSCYVKLASKSIMDSGGMAMVPGSWKEQI